MKIKNTIIYCMILCCSVTKAVASNTGNSKTIEGKIMDAISQSPLPYVSIVVTDSNHKVVTGTITDDEGHFEIKNLKSGTYFIEMTYIGFETKSQKITLNSKNSTVDLGVLFMSEDSAVLEEVEVVAEQSTVEQKIDRKVINVGKDLTTLGASAATVLNSVQSVSVDSQSGTISLRGNENVRVLVDGKPSTIPSSQLLKQLPSTSIKSIELITNPSAKYNPEGMSGIINIVLKKDSRNGFNAGFNSGINYGKNVRFDNSFNMNYRKGIVNFFGNFGLNEGANNNYGSVTSESIFQKVNNDEEYSRKLIKVGADLYLNKKNTVSFFVNTNLRDQNNIFRTTVTGDLNTDSPVDGNRDETTTSYNANYTHQFDREGEHLDFEAMHTYEDNDEKAIFKELVQPFDSTLNYRDDVLSENNLKLYNIDYVLPLSKTSSFEAGLEARFKTSSNERTTNQEDFVYTSDGNRIPTVVLFEGEENAWYRTSPVGNSAFKYNRDIYSLYVNYRHTFDNLSLQVGGRLEDYNIDAEFSALGQEEGFEDHIFTFYPSAFLTYKKDNKHQYQFSYSRRVDRPNLQQVNPIREWSTPLIVSVGNKELLPQFTNSFELNYTYQYEKGNVTFGTFYRLINDPILRSISEDPFFDEKVTLSFINGRQNNRYGFELSTNYRVGNWWRINASMDLYSQTENGIVANENVEVQNNAFNARISNSFSASKRLKFQLFGMYRGRNKSIQFDAAPMWMINLGSSLDVFDGKGTISFSANDVLKGMRYSFDAEMPAPSSGVFNWESQTVNLGFSYRFGSGKNRAKSRKRRDSNESAGSGGF